MQRPTATPLPDHGPNYCDALSTQHTVEPRGIALQPARSPFPVSDECQSLHDKTFTNDGGYHWYQSRLATCCNNGGYAACAVVHHTV